MLNLSQSISRSEGDPVILPHSKTTITDKYWSTKHPKIATGQITKDTAFGEKIYEISKDKHYKTYLEVGTWCGLGTTKCLLDGIIMRDDATLYSLESNYFFHETTNKYWSRYFEHYDIDKNKFKLHYGSLISFEEIPEDFTHDNGSTKHTYDYNLDIKKAPTIKIDRKIDVLCLDGGHFTTQQEWEMFKEQIKVIILDDVNTSKTRHILDEITHSSSWEIDYNSPNRNGELIAKKTD